MTVVDGRYAALAVRQVADAASGLLRPHHVRVALYHRDRGDRLRRGRVVPLDVTGPRTHVSELVGEPVADLVIVNDDDLTYAKLRFDASSLSTLLDGGLVRLEDAHTRSLCWTALLDMARDAELPVSRLVTAVAEQCPRETDQLVLERVLAATATLADRYTAGEHRAAALDALATAAVAQLSASSAALVWVRCLASTARRPDHLDVLVELIDGKRVVQELPVDVELRWLLLARLAAHGRAGRSQIEAALELDPTDAGRRRAAACLAAQPTAAAKADTWTVAMEDSTVSRATLFAALGGFSAGHFGAGGFHAGGRDQEQLTQPYVASYLEAIPRVWEERDYEMARVITEGLFPHEPPDGRTVEAVERVIAQPDLPVNCRRILMEGRDALIRADAARAADRAAV